MSWELWAEPRQLLISPDFDVSIHCPLCKIRWAHKAFTKDNALRHPDVIVDWVVHHWAEVKGTGLHEALKAEAQRASKARLAMMGKESHETIY